MPFTCGQGTEQLGKVRIFSQSACSRLLCETPLRYANKDEATSTQCLGCPFGSYGVAGLCSICTHRTGVCPGLTSRPLWNFSEPNGIFSLGGDPLSVFIAASDADVDATSVGSASVSAAELVDLAVAESPWDFCAPLKVEVPYVPPDKVSMSLWVIWAFIFTSLLFISFIVSAFATRWWVFGAIRKFADFLSEPRMKLSEQERFFGAFISLVAFCAVTFFSGVLVSSFAYENNLETIALLPVDITKNIFHDSFMSTKVPLSGDSVIGLQIRLTVSGDNDVCAVVRRSAAPSEGMKWQYLPTKCTVSGSVYQHQWTCVECTIPALFQFSVDLEPSCQSLILEMATTDSFGELTVVSTGNIEANEMGYVDTVSVSAVPLYTNLRDTVNGFNSRQGYTIAIEKPVVTRNAATIPFLDARTSSMVSAITPASAFIGIRIVFASQKFYVAKTINAKMQIQDLIAQLFGLTSITGIVFTAFNCLRLGIVGDREAKTEPVVKEYAVQHKPGSGGGYRDFKPNLFDDGHSPGSEKEGYMTRRFSPRDAYYDEPSAVDLRGSPTELVGRGKSPGGGRSSRVHPATTANPYHPMPTALDFFQEIGRNTHRVGGTTVMTIPVTRQLKLSLHPSLVEMEDDEIDRLRRSHS